jgi:hypothetical protein
MNALLLVQPAHVTHGSEKIEDESRRLDIRTSYYSLVHAALNFLPKFNETFEI